MTSPAQKRGFTLLELVVVIAIIMVISAMALPRIIETVSVYRLRSSASAVAGVFQKTRMQAVSDDRWYPVAQDSAGSYAYAEMSNPPDYTLNLDKENQLVAYLPRGIVIDNSASAPAYTSMNLDFTPTTGLPIFNARGLPCKTNGNACLPAMNSGAEGWSGYICYLRQDRSLGTPNWAAITVSPAGRVKVWTWNGAAWK